MIKKLEKDEQPGHAMLHMIRTKKCWENLKPFHIPMKNKSDSKNFYEQHP